MTRSSSAASLLVVLAALAPACILHGGEPYPLYPQPGIHRPDDEVARLYGPIARIDGNNVSKFGKSFALVPGCHIVRLLDKIGQINTANSGGFIGTIGYVVFALRMKRGYTYEIEVSTPVGTNHPVNQMTIQAWERAADGSGATAVAPAKTENDVADCRAWRP